MIACTTQLNTPGPDLAALPGVHALTDVTGFGLAGHALEIARGADAAVVIDWARVPLLPGVRALAAQGFVTGASGRNWAGYGSEVGLPAAFAAEDKALLTDPQTSGGLLVSCDVAAVPRGARDLRAPRLWRGGRDRRGGCRARRRQALDRALIRRKVAGSRMESTGEFRRGAFQGDLDHEQA